MWREVFGAGEPEALASALHRGTAMNWIEIAVLLAGWVLLQTFVLPRLGVPT